MAIYKKPDFQVNLVMQADALRRLCLWMEEGEQFTTEVTEHTFFAIISCQKQSPLPLLSYF